MKARSRGLISDAERALASASRPCASACAFGRSHSGCQFVIASPHHAIAQAGFHFVIASKCCCAFSYQKEFNIANAQHGTCLHPVPPGLKVTGRELPHCRKACLSASQGSPPLVLAAGACVITSHACRIQG